MHPFFFYHGDGKHPHGPFLGRFYLLSLYLFIFNVLEIFFLDYTVQRSHSTRTHTHLYEHTYANPTPISTFEGLSRQILKFTKSPQAPRCRRARRLLFNA